MKTKVFFILLCVSCGIVQAQSRMNDLIEAALDQPMEYKASDKPVSKLFEELSGQTGIQIGFAPGVVELLPHGVETRIESVELSGLSLRKGLTNLLDPLGMTFGVDDKGVVVYPIPAVQRIGHRMKWQDLETLGKLRVLEPGKNKEDASKVVGMARQAGSHMPADWAKQLADALSRVGAGDGIDAMEVACPALSLTWFPQESTIVVMTLADYYDACLGRWVSIQRQNVPLEVILDDLSVYAGVPVRLSAAVQQNPPEAVQAPFTIMADNATGKEILNQIAASTGLVWLVHEDGVHLLSPEESKGNSQMTVAQGSVRPLRTGSTGRARDPYVAKITMPSPDGQYQIEVILRQSDLSSETNQLLKTLREEADGVIRDALQKHFESQGIDVEMVQTTESQTAESPGE